MTIPSTNQTEILRAQNEVVFIAHSILSGTLGIVEAARQLAILAHRLAADRDPDFTFFIGVDSETDHLPVGDVRLRWATDELRRKDEELRECEHFFRADALQVCQSLIQKYGKHAT